MTTAAEIKHLQDHGLYSKSNEHDACGLGFVAHIKGVKRHDIVTGALKILENIDHRGAVGADKLMGDGAGILIQIPDQLYREEMAKQGVALPPAGEYGVGMIFLPKEHASRLACEQEMERAIKAEGQVLLGWRDVPVNRDMPMSPTVQEKEPILRQVFIGRGADVIVQDALERKLYVIRKTASAAIQNLKLKHSKEYYVPSMSSRTVVYKGLLLADQVGVYYNDLSDERCVSAIGLVHQRFSTNTFPEWPLAHPYRYVAHNGEINTVRGNCNWMLAREGVMASPVLAEDLKKLYPISFAGQSDTATFDNCLELLTMAGYPISQAVMMMIPEPWEQHESMDERRRAFYEYHAAMMEPWDGPASIVFTDGRQIGATLDRNGLRPSRYVITDDDLVILASEAGVLPVPDSSIVRKWRLQPGKMLLIDLEQGRLIEDDELKANIVNTKPYKQWIENLRIKLGSVGGDTHAGPEAASLPLLERQQAFGFTQEDIKFLLAPMAKNGEEGIGSMGNDSPLAVLSDKNKPLYNYFRQMFAQVTNPPIDPIREAIVMSLVSFIGPKPNLLDINQVNPPMRLEVHQPVLDFADMAKLRDIERHTQGKFKSATIDITYPLSWGKQGVEAKLASLCAQAVDAIKGGANILIISDRHVSATQVAIPALLALSAIHQHLVREGLRTTAGLVVETGTAREVHHFAVLAGYGAEAVHPYLAMETLADMHKELGGDLSADKAIYNYVKAIGKGLSKIMSKMGVSTYMSYCGAQLFEVIGLNSDTVDKYFTGTASRVEGIGVFEIAEETIRNHRAAFGDDPVLETMLDAGGEYAWRARGEEHMWSPDAIAKLQHSTRSNNWSTYKEYAQLINDQSKRHMTLRGLFEFKFDPAKAIALDQVESAKDIVKRFATGAMSLGSISTEAHATLAVAMNRIGGKSNTGEGGEDPQRYRNELKGIPIKKGETLGSIIGADKVEADIELQDGDSLRSRIKQVASGRFGVTAEYLSSSDQVQIKMAQGAKPGEGGQLPGGKVSDYIGKLRHSVPGVGLISPPPHHDIYSIEDLAQLIYDLKQINPVARVTVKLVAATGIGAIAAGVAKAKADVILVAGGVGGTGASPQTSVKYAGGPWEMGLSEANQVLTLNNLRHSIVLRADGGMRTGRDVVIAAMMGAEEFGIGTASLVAMGCIMVRQCHSNTCPVGVCTQDEALRAKFTGTPDKVINLFTFVAEEVREILAGLGFKSLQEIVGRTDLLAQVSRGGEHLDDLDLNPLLVRADPGANKPYNTVVGRNAVPDTLDAQIVRDAAPLLERGEKMQLTYTVRSTARTIGTRTSSHIVRKFGMKGLPAGHLTVQLKGSAGQSLGAFAVQGLRIELTGEANDYVGKGLSGATIVIKPARGLAAPETNALIGNTVLFGATSGRLFAAGQAGERFAVRNSGATTVVEGCGANGCEYMTGGQVVILGPTGGNFGAGMTGGMAFVLDQHDRFVDNTNPDSIVVQRLASPYWEGVLRSLIAEHARETDSVFAATLLRDWDRVRDQFWQVCPKEMVNRLPQPLAAEQAVA